MKKLLGFLFAGLLSALVREIAFQTGIPTLLAQWLFGLKPSPAVLAWMGWGFAFILWLALSLAEIRFSILERTLRHVLKWTPWRPNEIQPAISPFSISEEFQPLGDIDLAARRERKYRLVIKNLLSNRSLRGVRVFVESRSPGREGNARIPLRPSKGGTSFDLAPLEAELVDFVTLRETKRPIDPLLKLDRTKDFEELWGVAGLRGYQQNGVEFNLDGDEQVATIKVQTVDGVTPVTLPHRSWTLEVKAYADDNCPGTALFDVYIRDDGRLVVEESTLQLT